MIAIQEVTLQWGDRKVLDEVSWQIAPGSRWGLVGLNGCGKSTLLKIFAGVLQPDKGALTKARYCSIGYLPQDIEPIKDMTLYQAAESAFSQIFEIQTNIREADQALKQMDSRSQSYLQLLHRITEWEHELDGRDYIPSKIEKVLLGLGFEKSHFQRDVGEFSGGKQTRILMARLLLQNPSLLLLDEPTNHLDLPSLCWLESFLKKYTGTYVIISHDKHFLNTLCSQTAFLEAGRLDLYTGNYDAFEQERQQRALQQEQAYGNQQKEIKRVQTFIDRFRYKATKAAQVQSRIKMLDKIEKYTLTEAPKETRFNFPPALECGAWIISLEGISHAYGAHVIFPSLNVKVEKGDRIALVGANGEGKSTLLRLLAGVESIQKGKYQLGYGASLAYFSQQQAAHWSEEQTILEAMEAICPPGITESKLRSLLGTFLFSNDDVFKQISVLSGGEKARLKLAALLLRRSNCLLLDEPTNHLDMVAKNRLQETLLCYDGALVIVSHDRAFLEPLVNKVWEVKNKKVTVFQGSVSYYAEKTYGEAEVPENKKPASGVSAQTPKKDLKPLRKPKTNPVRLQVLETEIEALEKQLAELNQAMQAPDFFAQPLVAQEKVDVFQSLEKQIAEKYALWEFLQG